MSSNLALFIVLLPVMIMSVFLLIFIRLFSLLNFFPRNKDFVIGYHVVAKKNKL